MASSTLCVSFISKGYSIDFRIAFESETGEQVLVFPNTTYQNDVQQEVKTVLLKPGMYYIIWDNSNSWFRERIVEYTIHITLPDLDVQETVSCSR